MISVAAAEFLMGSDDFYPEEAPARMCRVGPFRLDAYPVTNAQFGHFVADTGYATIAERDLSPEEFLFLPAERRRPGSLVFHGTTGPVDRMSWQSWWSWTPGADWRHPSGPRSSTTGLEDHPVVQIAYADAVAYADWAGLRLPTEAEYEYAAGGGRRPAPYAWGAERDPGGIVMANTWHGRFPHQNLGANGWHGTSPVGAFSANRLGFYDLIGNVWEWTSDFYTATRSAGDSSRVDADIDAAASGGPGSGMPRRVLKGGSHLCAPEHSLRYRPAGRIPQAEDTATTHIGFRCAADIHRTL
ncbi:SUMF1/EgtB/PvdO family nonheme iron enzyme [Leifsonia sp. NPDC056665]|uniref:SUMF1/EgtB/PvdO family nonheme iron enzyme n=1 Tax=Leifsonia sp. NPDC056665 TaxID=3345901 RepID=UPI0036795BED